MGFARRLTTSGRFDFRFLCAAWLAGSAHVFRRWPESLFPPNRGVGWFVAACAVAAILGAGLLWFTRENGPREVFESSAAVGFWAVLFAVM